MSGLLKLITSPWAMEPAHHAEMVDIYLTHLRGDKIDIAAIEARLGAPLPGTVKGYDVVDGVAVVPVDGIISKKMNMLTKVSGGTSLELFVRDFGAALSDPAVHSIVPFIDSPGGTTMGLQEAGNVIYRARGIKPIVAVTDGMMASAAYWLGSAADSVWISSDTTMVGSIGVIYRHIDRSGADTKAGLKVTEVYAGKYKTMASEVAPLSDEAKADIQGKVDSLYSLFVNTVAQHRGVDAATVLAQMADGRVFLGREAIAAGLVDGMHSLDEVIRHLNAGTMPMKRNRMMAGAAVAGADLTGAGDAPKTSAAPIETNMEVTMTISKEFILANHPDIAEAFRAEGYTRGQQEGLAAGAQAERDRIAGVEAQSMPGHEKLIVALKADGKTTGPEAAVQVLAAERVVNAGRLSAMANDAPNPAPHAPAPAAGAQAAAAAAADASKPIEERCKAKWEADAAIRAEFLDLASYTAFERANAEGKVKILGRRTA